MIHLKANTRRAVALSDDLITSGSAGIEVEILCSDAWEGLTKTVLFRGSGSSVDLVLSGCSCTVPPEVLTVPGGQLLIGLYGSDGSGNLAIPTVWADAGRILQGAEPSGIAPTPAQKSALDQAIEALNAATEEIPEQVNAAVEEAVSSGTFADVFWITQGVTTADEIYAANAAGKVCLMKPAPGVLYYLTWCGEVQNLGPSGVVLEKQAILTAWDGDEKTTIRVMHETWLSPVTVKFARTASPTFTGAPKAPTAEAGTNSTQIASTAFVNAAIQAALEGFTPGQTISEELKQALLQLARKVAYIDDQGETYYQDLYDALYPPAVLESIEAVFVQGSTVIYNTDSLDVLKPLLTVTAVYDDGSTETVPAADYTLSGALATGASTITASYQDKTATFQVTVTAAPMSFSVTNNLTGCTTSNSAAATMENEPYSAVITPAAGYTLTGASVVITMAGQDITASAYSNGAINIAQVTGALVISIVAQEIVLSSISAAYTQSGTVYDTDTLESLKSDLVVTAAYSDGTSTVLAADAYTLSGTLTAGTSTITVSYGGKTTTFQVTVTHEAWYVTDGLLMLLDGQKNGVNGAHETTLTTWVDQSGNGYNFTNHGATVNAKSIVFADPSYLTMGQALPDGVKTIEIVMSTPHSSGAMILAGFGDAKPGNIQMGTGDGMLFHTGTTKNGWTKITADWVGIHAYSCVGSAKGYRDGVDALASISVSSSWANKTPRIGLYNGGGTNQFVGEIYCLRLYNRELTEAEVLANYSVDAARFGIGG